MKLSPRVDLGVIIIAPPDVIQSRKQEVTWEETARQVVAYREAVGWFSRAIVVENVGSPNRSANRIVSEILQR